MKTRNIYGGLLMAAAALLCLAGCKKENEGRNVTLKVAFEQTAGQKMYLGPGNAVYWYNDEAVNVNGYDTCKVINGLVSVPEAASYAAVYPATGSVTSEGGSVTIPRVQHYKAIDGQQQIEAPMAAYLDAGSGVLMFRNLASLMRIRVTNPSATENLTLKSVTLMAGTRPLSGTYTFTFDGNTNSGVPSGSITADGKTYATLTFDNEETIEPNGEKTYFLVVAPFSNETHLTVLIRDEQNIYTKQSPEAAYELKRSAIGSVSADLSLMDHSGFFSVASGRYVTFSPGNLQYRASTNTWRFAEHQWDYVGDATKGTVYEEGKKCNNKDFTPTYTGWIDFFAWGTSGYDNKYPYMSSTENNDYGDGEKDIAGTQYDWGMNNAIYIPRTGIQDAPGTWRTLTIDEWRYLLGTESGTRGANSSWWIFNKVTIQKADGTKDVTGLIIYPDGVTEDITGKLSSKAGTTAVSITKADFDKLEAMGCVFLPAAGYRQENEIGNVQLHGNYWSSTHSGPGNAYYLIFINNTTSPLDLNLPNHRSFARSVRLVKDVK